MHSIHLNLYAVVSWIVLCATASGVTIWVAYLCRLQRSVQTILGALTAVVTVSLLALLAIFVEHSPSSVAIVDPTSISTVGGSTIEVVGTVNPSDARVTVLARAESDTRWWVQPIVRGVRSENEEGSWSVSAALGTETVGRHENYQLIALSSVNSPIFNILTGRYLREGDTYSTIPLWNLSEPITVRRLE